MAKQFKVTLSREVAQSAEIVVTADNMADARFAAALALAERAEQPTWTPDPTKTRPRVVDVTAAE